MCTSRPRNVSCHCLVGVAFLATAIAGGIAAAGGDASSLPLQGPIPFQAFDLDGSGAITHQEFDEAHGRRAEERAKAGLPAPRRSRSFGSIDSNDDGTIDPERALHEGTILDHYRIRSKLGGGTFGTVFAAWDLQLERMVAIKVLNRSIFESREAVVVWRSRSISLPRASSGGGPSAMPQSATRRLAAAAASAVLVGCATVRF